MRTWLSKNGLQVLVLLISFAMAVAIKVDYAHLNVYLGIASMCGLLGIKLMPLYLFESDPSSKSKAEAEAPTTGKSKGDDDHMPPPPALMAFAFVMMGLGLVVLQACTPAQWKATSTGFANAAVCIEAQARPGSDPKAVALACGLEAIPDVLNVISSVVMSKTIAQSDAKKLSNCTVIVVDAGAPDGAGK